MRISADCIDQEVAKNQNALETSPSEIHCEREKRNITMDETRKARHIGVIYESTKSTKGRPRKNKTIKIPFPDANTSWCCFRSRLLQACNTNPSSQVEICYLDDEEDKIHINSDDEFIEAMRVAEHMQPFILIVKERSSASATMSPQSKEAAADSTKPRSFTVISDARGYSSDSENDDFFEQNDLSSAASKLDVAVPPIWFESYMMKMEAAIISKVSKELEKMTSVLQALKPEGDGNQKKQAVAEDEGAGILHEGITCDSCERSIRGVRYKCEKCEDYDLCMKCEAIPDVHVKDHLFLKIKKPLRTRPLHLIAKPKKSKSAQISVSVNQSDDQQAAANTSVPAHQQARLSSQDLMQMFSDVKSKREKKMAKMKYAKRSFSPLRARSVAAIPTIDARCLPQRSLFRYGSLNTDKEETAIPASHHNIMNAKFIKEEGISESTRILPPGMTFVMYWKVRNTGTKKWNENTTLECCVKTDAFKPDAVRYPAPPLEPGAEGMVFIPFTTPMEIGRHQSAFRFCHREQPFGDTLWCNVEVVPSPNSPPTWTPAPPATEKEAKIPKTPPSPVEKANQKSSEVTNDIAQALKIVVQVEQDENGQLTGRKKVVMSHTTTPTNTPFDMTPPKSPEPQPKEAQKLPAILDVRQDALIEKDGANENEDAASVLSLSSSDTDTEFVVIPVPSPFNGTPFRTHTPTALLDQMNCSQYSMLSGENFEMVRRRGSSKSSNGEDDHAGFKSSTVSEHPASSSSDITSAESSEGGETDVVIGYATGDGSPQQTEKLSVTDDVKSGLDARIMMEAAKPPDFQVGSQNNESVQPDASGGAAVLEVVSAASSSMPTAIVYAQGVSEVVEAPASVIAKTATNINPQAYANAVTSQETRSAKKTIDVLPEGLMNGALTAAATVYNTTREFISSIQRQNSEPPPQDIYCQEPVWIPPEETEPPNIRQPATAMDTLVEMGFCNLALNETLLAKHNGNVPEVVAELVATTDNNWFEHRHRPEPQLNFD